MVAPQEAADSRVVLPKYTRAMSHTAYVPSSSKSRGLRACLLCSVIQSVADFRKYGCPNCEEVLQVRVSATAHVVLMLMQSR